MSTEEREAPFDETGLQREWERLLGFIKQAVEAGMTVDEVENSLWDRLLALGRGVFGMFFQHCGDGDQGEVVILPGGRTVKRLDALHRRIFVSIFGKFELFRRVYGTREGQTIEWVPLDQQLQLPASRFSYLLQDWDQSLAVEMPYAQVEGTIAKILGFSQSVHSLERINRQLAADVSAFWENAPLPPPEQEGALLVCTADGKGIPIRDPEKKVPLAEAPPEADGKPGGKKMAIVGSVYTVDEYKRTPEAVLEALFREGESPPGRPKPVGKAIRASLIRDVQGTSKPSFDEIFGWMGTCAQRRNPSGERPILLLMDGQEALWNAGLKHLPEEWHVIEILDLLHAISYVWSAAHLFHPQGSAQAKTFVKTRVSQVLHGQVNAVIRGLRWMGTHHKLTGTRAETLETVCGYLENNAHRMAYSQYLAAGYPIASGVIEGACRHVVKDRMERSGMRWVLDGAHSMLSLRCIALSGHWDELMRFHRHSATQRLYPHRAANDAEMQLPLVA